MSCGNNSMSPLCSSCSSASITMGTCSALAPSYSSGVYSEVASWVLYSAFLLILLALVTRRTSFIYAMWAPIISGLIAWICQQTITSPRPEGSCFKAGCGMPSGHCAVGFATGFTLLFIWSREAYYMHNQHVLFFLFTRIQIFAIFRFLLRVFVLIMFFSQPYARLTLKYHTEQQVLFGCLLGFFVAFVLCLFIYFVIDDYTLIVNRYDLVTYGNVFKVFDCEARKKKKEEEEEEEEKKNLLP